MYLFENYLKHVIKDVFIKFTLIVLLLFFFITSKAQQTFIDSTEIAKRTAFQDSIFKGLIKVQPYTSKKEKANITAKKPTAEDIAANTKFTGTLRDTVFNNNSLSGKVEKSKKIKPLDTARYSPKKAAIWGAACPGLGQIYMKKYWKLPIVYGILGATIYFVASNGKKLRTYNGYIRNIYDSVPNPSPIDQLGLNEVESFRNTYRRNVQLASFGTMFAWGLSIVDAVVDAHLHSFDISDKLSMRIKPDINYSNFTYYTGIGVHLNFK